MAVTIGDVGRSLIEIQNRLQRYANQVDSLARKCSEYVQNNTELMAVLTPQGIVSPSLQQAQIEIGKFVDFMTLAYLTRDKINEFIKNNGFDVQKANELINECKTIESSYYQLGFETGMLNFSNLRI